MASTYAFVNPVIAVFLGWLLAGETLTGWVFGATGLIVVAVVLITMSGPKAKEIRRVK
jgi:drug/metabolite transporter (DMT)-like permease